MYMYNVLYVAFQTHAPPYQQTAYFQCVDGSRRQLPYIYKYNVCISCRVSYRILK